MITQQAGTCVYRELAKSQINNWTKDVGVCYLQREGSKHPDLSSENIPPWLSLSRNLYVSHNICNLSFSLHMLFFHRRHREKLQAHFSDSRSLRDCSVNASGLMSKSTPRLQYSLQLQKVNLYITLIYFQSYLNHYYHHFHLNIYTYSISAKKQRKQSLQSA